MRVESFFSFARARHQIYLDRAAGKPAPWTDDPVLQQFRFTNVYRELDRTTVWFRQRVRDPLRCDPRVLLATIAFRWFNRIETGEVIKDLFYAWDSDEARRRLAGVSPVVTGAYIIKTPDGMNKLDGVLWCIDQCAADIDRLCAAMHGASLQEAWRTLCEMPFMGPFMAYEVITDLRYTYLLVDAHDVLTWANPGPGCRRGLSRVCGRDKEYYRSGQEAEILEHMQDLLYLSGAYFDKQPDWPKWEMREVEHLLCEFDKFERATNGEGRPKQRFTPAAT